MFDRGNTIYLMWNLLRVTVMHHCSASICNSVFWSVPVYYVNLVLCYVNLVLCGDLPFVDSELSCMILGCKCHVLLAIVKNFVLL